jgi:AcrR family transcriptional regulator
VVVEERVTVAEVARAAEVSEKTVFNYFPSKENLVFWRLASFEDELLDAIRTRAPGESVLAGFGRFVLQRRGLLADQDAAARAALLGVTRRSPRARRCSSASSRSSSATPARSPISSRGNSEPSPATSSRGWRPTP